MVLNGNKRKVHYITGLGDGNAKPSLRSRNHDVADGDDDNYENFLRTELKHSNRKRLRHPTGGASEHSWGEKFFGGGSSHHRHHRNPAELGGGNGDYDPVEAAPWQLSAFALLGAVILLSALFLHVLADTTAETQLQAQRRLQKRNNGKKEKQEDAGNLDPWNASDAYSEEPSLTSESQQSPPLYYPYQPRLRKTNTGSKHQNYQHSVYNLNPGGTTKTTSAATPSPNTGTNAKIYKSPKGPAVHVQPAAGLRQPSIVRATADDPTSKSHQPKPGSSHKVPSYSQVQKSPPHLYKPTRSSSSRKAGPQSSDISPFASYSSDVSKGMKPPVSPMVSVAPSEQSFGSALNLGFEESVHTQDLTERHYNGSQDGEEYEFTEHSFIEETPRIVNGRSVVAPLNAAPQLPLPAKAFTNDPPPPPYMPSLKRNEEMLQTQQTSPTPRPPASMTIDDLQLQNMESGSGHQWATKDSLSYPSPPPMPPKVQRETKALPRIPSRDSMTSLGIVDDENISSGRDVLDENDPRRNIDHVRSDLTEGTDAARSLQGVIDFSEIRLVEVIGGGGFGQVWRATWRSTPVAVKVLTGSAQSQKVPRPVLEEFAAEINLLRGMRHPNICLYMGASLKPPNRAIITELAANGSLWDALRLSLNPPYRPVGKGEGDMSEGEAWPPNLYHPDPRHGLPPSASSRRLQAGVTPPIPAGTWSWPLVKRVACGTARGMAYLHSGSPPVLHRDLKSANILLDEAYTPKVCDFGLSRLQSTANASLTGNVGTVQWMAPEVLANQRYNEKADIFSYGIILWELLTRTCPYEGMNAVQCALAVLNRNHRPSIPNWCPPFLHALIRACLKTDPSERPNFEQILEALEATP